jgi:hypothetical protein
VIDPAAGNAHWRVKPLLRFDCVGLAVKKQITLGFYAQFVQLFRYLGTNTFKIP